MTAWRHVTEDQLRKRGLLAEEVSAAPVAPARARAAGESVRTGHEQEYLLITKQPQVTMPVLINILGVALSEAFPGVFVTIPALGIHWGNEGLRVGVNVGSWVYAGHERGGWRIIPCRPRDVLERMPALCRQIAGLVQGEYHAESREEYCTLSRPHR